VGTVTALGERGGQRRIDALRAQAVAQQAANSGSSSTINTRMVAN